MESDLEGAVKRSREMIRQALIEARTELKELEARKHELEGEIGEAEALLGERPEQTRTGPDMTLHEALAYLLREGGNQGMTASELADSVTARGLYRKRDGNPVAANQIQARVNNYGAMFEKDGSLIRLRGDAPAFDSTPIGVTVFKDDDDGFFDWLAESQHGYFVNTERKPNPNYLVLHHAQCPHFTGGPELRWTKDYVKVCSTDRSDLEAWAVDSVGGEVTLCGTCFG